jgi:branched-chain amino acid transport system ATP-binding protein
MTPLLHVDKMTHYFGGLRAVHNYNLSVGPNQIVGLIGPNGAGKTTVFNLITGVYTPTEGRITLENENILGLETNEIAAKGLGRTFQNLALWRHMNVLDHIKMAHYSQLPTACSMHSSIPANAASRKPKPKKTPTGFWNCLILSGTRTSW